MQIPKNFLQCTPCNIKASCYKYPATSKLYDCAMCGIGCNCPPKKGGLLPCPEPPYSSKVHYLDTYAGLPPPSKLVPGYLNQGTDGNFKTRWFPVTWGDLMCCANHFHMRESIRGVRLKDELLIPKLPCDDVCDCCQNNLIRGERLRIISHSKRVRGAGDRVMACLRKKAKSSCNPCNCPPSLNPGTCRCG